MCRDAFASNVADAGGSLDQIQLLLGHASPGSSQPYLHLHPGRLREAVERVPTPRELPAGSVPVTAAAIPPPPSGTRTR